MRQIFLSMLFIIISFSFIVNDASARRFGGGSFGMMRSKSMFSQAPRAQKAPSATAARQANRSRWGGALSGLLIGGLLASLFMGHGLGSTLFSWFILGMAIYLIVNFFRRQKMMRDR